MSKRHAVLVPLAAALALAFASFAVANNGVGPNKSSSSISLSSGTASLTSAPRYGDVVTFDVSTNETIYPFVNLQCSQNNKLVASSWSAYFAGGFGGESFGLNSPAWAGGAAECTANLDTLVNGKWKVLASTSFHVDA
jgi:hypothetical protein